MCFVYVLGKQSLIVFFAAIPGKLFKTKSSFYVEWCTTGKVQYPFSESFVLVFTKFSFWREDWALGYNFMKVRDFPDIS